MIQLYGNLDKILTDLKWEFTLGSRAPSVDVGEWQSMSTEGSKAHVTRELLNVSFAVEIPGTKGELQEMVYGDTDKGVVVARKVLEVLAPENPLANLVWAEDHFQERVSGKPLNPPPSEAYWPWNFGNDRYKEGEKFSHTYPERYWPKWANREATKHSNEYRAKGYERPNEGIRYEYGDLQDVVNQLAKSPYTRQAYLPVWFPEDTGAVSGQRVPCSLGYQFILREGKLHCTYWIRSCDFVRHFKNDFYMTARLLQWVVEKLNYALDPEGYKPEERDVKPGTLTMHITSLHVFEGDVRRLDST